MKGKICSLPYINRIRNNVLSIKSKELEVFYEDLQNSDIILPIASGRSRCAISVPLNQLVAMRKKKEKIVIPPEGPGFPLESLYETALMLEEIYGENRRILFLINSGSGRTQYACTAAEELARYMEERKPKNFKINAITSDSNSPVGKIAKEYGDILEIKGKEIFPESEGYSERGIMGDMFELASSSSCQIMVKMLYQDSRPETFYTLAEEEFWTIGEMIENALNSPFYASAIDILEKRSHVFGNAKGTGEEVVKATLIRLDHVKEAVGDRVYITNPPRPRAGDFQLSVSYSGSTLSVVEAAKKFKELKCYQFSVISKEGSDLEKVSDYTLILPESSEKGEPRMFYLRSLYILSPLPIKLIERFQETGIILPETILRYYHSVTE